MTTLRTLSILILIIIRLLSFIFQGIIYVYLKRKSPGMKTVFDELVQELIIGATITSLSSDIVATCGYGPVPVQVAVLFWLTQRASAQYWLMQIFVTFFVRYLCIFHATTVQTFQDNVILLVSRLLCTTWTFSTSLYDYAYNDFEIYKRITKFMANETDEEVEVHEQANVFLQYIICIDLLFATFVVVRIEFYNHSGQIPLSKVTIRMILGLVLVIGASVMMRLSLPYMPLQDNALYFHIFFTFLLMVFIPFLVIKDNDNMRKFARRKWSTENSSAVTPI